MGFLFPFYISDTRITLFVCILKFLINVWRFEVINLFFHIIISWLIFGSIRALEIKTSMLFNLDFNYNTVLIPTVITETFNPIADLVTPIGIPSQKVKSYYYIL